ncbi:Heat shock protein 30, partial [Anabarilius grahami]
QHQIFMETQQKEIYPVTCAMEKEGSGFALTLATFPWRSCQSFRSAGSCRCAERPRRSRRILGKARTESRSSEGCLICLKGVNPEGLSCSMADNGKLYMQVPVNQRPEDAERRISTDCEDWTHDATTDQKMVSFLYKYCVVNCFVVSK